MPSTKSLFFLFFVQKVCMSGRVPHEIAIGVEGTPNMNMLLQNRSELSWASEYYRTMRTTSWCCRWTAVHIYGLSVVLLYRYPDGSERPISCVSHSRNLQLHKEALAGLFGVTKHHQYFKKRGIPQTATSRMQGWAARRGAYDFIIMLVQSAEYGVIDASSRLPLPPKSCASQKVAE